MFAWLAESVDAFQVMDWPKAAGGLKEGVNVASAPKRVTKVASKRTVLRWIGASRSMKILLRQKWNGLRRFACYQSERNIRTAGNGPEVISVKIYGGDGNSAKKL